MNEFLENTISYMKENKRHVGFIICDCSKIFKNVKHEDLIIILTIRLRIEFGDKYYIPRPILFGNNAVTVEMYPK